MLVHSGLWGALRVAGDSAAAKVDTVLEALRAAVSEGTLILPTFTYSFCRGERFDVAETPSTVGAVTERFRRLPGVRRTTDPLFSTAVLGGLPAEWEARLYSVHDTDAFGEQSVFSYLRSVNAKMVFFGVGFEYATFVHHVEQRLGVPYRYPKDFHGVVRDGGAEVPVTARYFVRPLDGDIEVHLDPLAEALLAEGKAASATLALGPALLVTDAWSIEETIRRKLEENPSFLLRRGHPASSASPT
jgi:aminoglycoside 3-N-acetyltransferase